MIASERLRHYHRALFHYRLTRLFPWLSDRYNTNTGFCRYFSTYRDTSLFMLSELYVQRPTHVANDGSYWFTLGHKTPRIECLKRAIHLCKTNPHPNPEDPNTEE